MEGQKSVDSIISADTYQIEELYATAQWVNSNPTYPKDLSVIVLTQREIQKISEHKSAPSVVAVVTLPKSKACDLSKINTAIYLDDIQDPGNVGTIIRIADWYGIDGVLRSNGSADFYNAKVIQSCMGSFTNLCLGTISHEELTSSAAGMTMITTQMTGTPLKQISSPNRFILIMGNEGLGVRKELLSQDHQSIGIQGSSSRIAESLNVAVATGIICQHLMEPKIRT